MKCCFTTFSSKIFDFLLYTFYISWVLNLVVYRGRKEKISDFLYDIHLKRYIGLVVYGVEGCVALMKPRFILSLGLYSVTFMGGVRYIPQYILRIQKNIYGGIYF